MTLSTSKFALLCLLSVLFSSGVPPLQAEESTTTMPETASASSKVYLWLFDKGKVLGSGIVCFQSNLQITKTPNVLINTSSYGPIGVKEVIDALHYQVDAPCPTHFGLPWPLAQLALAPTEVLHIVWEPAVPQYTFYLRGQGNGEPDGCRDGFDFPNFNGPPVLRLDARLGECNMIELDRIANSPAGSGAQIRVSIPETCL